VSGWGLAVDYGTSFTAVVDGDGVVEVVEVEDSRRFPPGVLLGEDGLVVGRPAVNQARRRPERFERCPKRLVGKTAVLLGG
jgi:molecular chaperone DnaK (HSP70)